MEQRTAHYSWAEAALGGAIFYDDPRVMLAHTAPEQLLAEEMEQRRLFYAVALNGIARARREERLSSEDPFDNAAWQPLPYQLEALQPDNEPLARRLALINNLERHVAEYKVDPKRTNLRPHQKDSFDRTLDFVRTTTPEVLKFDDDPIEAIVTKGGYFDLPTAYGKMFMMVELSKAFGIGKPASEASPRRLRSLVLVPRKVLAKQVLKEFEEHAPDIKATNHGAHEPDDSGDVVVMTYQMFNGLMERGLMSYFGFDMVMCDEAHHGLGDTTRQNLEEFRRGILAMGFTASPDFAEDHKVEQILPYLIQRTDVRTAIEAGGILSGVQCVSYATGAEIVVRNFGAEDFTEAELATLAENEARNSQARQFARVFVESGLQGIINCIPGGDCKHAREMADALTYAPESEWITDPKTGERRPIRAEAVGGFLSDDRLDEILQDYEDGKIDVLTYVKIIGEGWDSEKAKFLLSLSPTTSPVRAIQRFGRVLRPGATACVVEFIDTVVNGFKKAQYTFMHIMGEEVIAQQRVYGKSRSGGRLSPVLNLKALPTEMRERIATLEAVPIDELTVMPRALVDPPPDWVAMPTLVELAMGMNGQYIRKLLVENGFEGRIARGRINTPTYYFAPEAVDFLKANIILDRPEPGWLVMTRMAKALDISASMVGRILGDLEIAGKRCRAAAGNRATLFYTPAEFLRVKAVVDKIEVAAPGEDSWDSMVAEWNVSKALIFNKCRDLGIEGVLKRVRERGPLANYFTSAQKETIRVALDVKPVAPGGWRSILGMAKQAQVGRTVVELYLSEQGLLSAAQVFRGAAGKKVTGATQQWPPHIVSQVVAAIGVGEVPEGWQALYDYANARGIWAGKVRAAARELGLHTQEIRVARRRPLPYASPQELARLDEYFGFA